MVEIGEETKKQEALIGNRLEGQTSDMNKEQWLAVGVTFLDIVWLLLGEKEKEREQKEREGRNKNRSCSVHSVHLSPCLSLRLHEEDGVDVKVHCCRV
jgi:hypothetical protein